MYCVNVVVVFCLPSIWFVGCFVYGEVVMLVVLSRKFVWDGSRCVCRCTNLNGVGLSGVGWSKVE